MIRKYKNLLILTFIVCITTFLAYSLPGYYLTKQGAINAAIEALDFESYSIAYTWEEQNNTIIAFDTPGGLFSVEIKKHNPLKYSVNTSYYHQYNTTLKAIWNYSFGNEYLFFVENNEFKILAPNVDSIEFYTFNATTLKIEPIAGENKFEKQSDGIFLIDMNRIQNNFYILRDKDGDVIDSIGYLGNKSTIITHIKGERLSEVRRMDPMVLYHLNGSEVNDTDVLIQTTISARLEDMPVFFENNLKAERFDAFEDLDVTIRPSVQADYDRWIEDGMSPNALLTFLMITPTSTDVEPTGTVDYDYSIIDVTSYLKIVTTLKP